MGKTELSTHRWSNLLPKASILIRTSWPGFFCRQQFLFGCSISGVSKPSARWNPENAAAAPQTIVASALDYSRKNYDFQGEEKYYQYILAYSQTFRRTSTPVLTGTGDMSLRNPMRKALRPLAQQYDLNGSHLPKIPYNPHIPTEKRPIGAASAQLAMFHSPEWKICEKTQKEKIEKHWLFIKWCAMMFPSVGCNPYGIKFPFQEEGTAYLLQALQSGLFFSFLPSE